jgi:predicted LPLAT superfamily acyltransferase
VNKRPQWEGRTHGGSLGQKGLLFFFRYTNYSLGKIILYPILSIAVFFYMIFSYRGFQSIWFYFRKIHNFGILKSLYKTYLNHFLFGENLFDKFALFTGKNSAFKLSISGQELFDEVINSPKGAIIASSHIGNFEISGYILHQTKKRINGIIYSEENPVIQQFRNKILEKNNVFQIPILEDLSHIFTISSVLSKGEILTMPCDRIYTGNKTIELEFLGKNADFPTGAYHLAAKFEVPVLTLFVIKESMNHYHLYLNRIDNYVSDNLSVKEKVELLARNYVSELEKMLKKFPEQWYNFYKFWKSE